MENIKARALDFLVWLKVDRLPINTISLTYLNKKSPTSEVGDELCSAPLDKYAMICYDIISRNEKEVDYIWN